MAKVLEKVIYNQIGPGILSRTCPTQFGFKPSHGTEDALWTLSLLRRPNYPLFLCSLDIAKAFDSVPLDIQVRSIHTFDPSLDWFAAFISHWFSNRRKILKVEHDRLLDAGVASNRGVPQGSILSPLVFNLVMENVARDIAALVIPDADTLVLPTLASPIQFIFYADDMFLLSRSLESMQLLLDCVSNSIHRLGMSLNVSKCSLTPLNRLAAICTRYCALPKLAGVPITVKDSTKVLGVSFSKSVLACDYARGGLVKDALQRLQYGFFRKLTSNGGVDVKLLVTFGTLWSTAAFGSPIVKPSPISVSSCLLGLKMCFGLSKHAANTPLLSFTGVPDPAAFSDFLLIRFCARILSGRGPALLVGPLSALVHRCLATLGSGHGNLERPHPWERRLFDCLSRCVRKWPSLLGCMDVLSTPDLLQRFADFIKADSDVDAPCSMFKRAHPVLRYLPQAAPAVYRFWGPSLSGISWSHDSKLPACHVCGCYSDSGSHLVECTGTRPGLATLSEELGPAVEDIRRAVNDAVAGNFDCDWSLASTAMNRMLELRNRCVVTPNPPERSVQEPPIWDSTDDILAWKIFEITEIDEE